ncbi:hypothetical protein BUALT_Bualt02G0201300 [Buddleja alternifolia]|uniref:AIG1-type G domain-containing protein n=1 Tax=Buddleja alternifolia TaxID=168488 RepID=A0AAV6Y1R8_9LAMI|nr:hypothetical protein BUALT_Bualt02G0201300 [Buddleja alternifolia]
MENGVGVADYANKVEERQVVDGQVFDQPINENQDLSVDGSKDSDGEEAFKETVETETPTVISDNILINEGGNVELMGTFENGKDSNIVNEDVEEMFVTPDAARTSEDSGAKAEFLTSEEDPNVKHIATEEVVSDETNGSLDEGTLVVGKGDSGEIVDSAAAGKTDNSYGDEVKEKLAQSPQMPEAGVSDNPTFLETLTSEHVKVVDADTKVDPIFETLSSEHAKVLDADTKVDQNFEMSTGAEADPDKPDAKGYIHTILENQDSNDVKEDDFGFEKPENGALDHVKLAGTLNHEAIKPTYADTLKGRPPETSLEIKDANGTEGSVPGPESQSNGEILHNDEQNFMLNESVATLGFGSQQDKSENISDNLQFELREDPAGVQEEKSFTSGANLKDDEKNELEVIDSGSVELQKKIHQDVDMEENKVIVTADAYVTDQVKESSELDTNVPPVVEESSAAEVEKLHFSSSKLLVGSSSSSEPQPVDASAEVSTFVEGPEKEGAKDEKKEEYFSENREKEVGPMNDISSSSSKSPTSSLTSAYPARLDSAAKVRELVLQDTSHNGEKEIKPAADIPSSSGNSIPSRPAGLGHTAPLLEPTPQKNSGNKESMSRSAANLQSTSNTSASLARPAGLGGAAPLLEPASRVVQQPRVNGAISPAQNQHTDDLTNGEAEEYDETREKLQMIRVKFLRLAHRLGQTPHNVVVAQVLYRLGLAEQLRGRSGGRVGAFSFDRASAMAEQLEAAAQEPLDFTCTIMVLGKSGVGKSATINSIFDDVMFGTDAFQLGTKKVQDIVGTVQGIKVRVIDTPGLLPSWSDQRQNEKILRSVKNFIKKTPPDIVLYLDRLDMQSRDNCDMPLLRTITEIFGPSIWFNAIVVLTHAASAPPEGPNGTTTSYDMFVTQRSHVVQQAIRQAAGDMRLMNPVSLVENHSACRTNRAGQRVLPNGQVWKPHLLLLSFASKILAEANTLLKLQDSSPPGRPFAPRTRSPPLPFLLSSLLQSRPEVKLPSEQFGDDDAIDDDLDESSDSEDESELDELPPFKPLTRAQLEKLTKVQRKAYYDELEYREKLFMKKQLKEEKERRKMLKKMQEAMKDLPADYGENAEEETSGAASVPVPMPDLALPASFDSDNPTHRYRSLDSSNPWLVRAVLEPNGWDHDIGYEGVNVERLFVVKDKIPISFSGHISKDKKDANLQMEVASSVKHGKGKATSLGFDMQSVGKDMAYTLRSETRFSNRRINKASAGLSATLIGDILSGGIKLEDKLIVGKRGQLVVSGGAIYGRGDVAYGGSLEATLKDKDHPLGRFLSTLGLSVMDWHGDLAIGCNSQTQIPVGRHTNLIGRFNINNRGSGQVSVRLNSSEQLQIVLIGLIPLVKKLLGYSQQVQYG